jgi:hypothetical protein
VSCSERVVLVAGAALVVALILVLPLALALVPQEALGDGSGDVTAAALHGLDRGLHAAGPLPALGAAIPWPPLPLGAALPGTDDPAAPPAPEGPPSHAAAGPEGRPLLL